MTRDELITSAEALLELDAGGALVPHGIGGLARTIIEGFISLARNAQGAGADAQRVKALEWEQKSGSSTLMAKTPFGPQYVVYSSGPEWWSWGIPGQNIEGGRAGYVGPDEAKAAAQADFEQRIRSCLVTPSKPSASEAVAWRWRFVDNREWSVSTTDPAAMLSKDAVVIEPLGVLTTPSGEGGEAASVAIAEIAAERSRQVSAEGWTPEHDDKHADGELGLAAACYAAPVPIRCEWDVPDGARSAGEGSAVFPTREWLPAWPWDDKWWKPTDRRRDLIKAGALIVAEIERLDRAREALANTEPKK